MENLFKLETDCRVSVTKHIQGQRGISARNKANSVHTRNFWSSTAIKSLSLVWSALNRLFKAGSFLFIAIFIIYQSTSTHEPLVEPPFAILRLITMALKLYKLPQFEDAYNKNCFLVNPYYEVKDADCQMCSNITETIDLTSLNESEFLKTYHHNGIPFIIKDSFQTPINLDNLKEILSESLHFENYPTEKYSHIKLQTNPSNLPMGFRKIFPAPDFIPRKSQLYFQQTIYFDGLSASDYSLPPTYFQNTILLQAKGRRMVKLVPIWQCQSACSSVSVVLEPGHAMYYTEYFWRASSGPISDETESEDFSITNVGCFSRPTPSS